MLAVGDLHVENFGTWRDLEGRLIWGINDVDEACGLPYTQDLVRLATSAVLATQSRHFALAHPRCVRRDSGRVRRLVRAELRRVVDERQMSSPPSVLLA